MKLKSVTVNELVVALANRCIVAGISAAETPVRVWLPGSTIALSNVFVRDGEIHIEGNVDPGSALLDPTT